LKDWKACLDYLEADIICFQEVKLTRKNLVADHRDMCIPEGYEAYYSLHPTKGYSGVATFVKKDVCDVRKAEMGLTGELVANRLDQGTSIGGYPDVRAPESPMYDQIDKEGRGVVIDCGLFVLFNLYCPNETDEGRRDYKMAYYLTLDERVQNLLASGREVIIVGDLNIAHLPIDHCEGVNQRTRDQHLDIHPARRWLDGFLAPNGPFHDVTRRQHPTRKFMYTCWDTVKDTRPANYGVRIDYTFVSRGLLPWIKDADIQPNIYGSDHCPVYVDLKDEILADDGRTLRLVDHLKLGGDVKRKPPAIATANWPEFVGRRIQSFFATKTAVNGTTPSPSPAPSTSTPIEPTPVITASNPPSAASEIADKSIKASSPIKEVTTTKPTTASPHKKVMRKSESPHAKPSTQLGLRAFFQQPGKNAVPTDAREEEDEQVLAEVLRRSAAEAKDSEQSHEELSASQMLDEGAATAAAAPDDCEEDESSSADRVTSALAWGSIFAPKQPPLCSVHREPAKPWRVNKPGANHGRKFWMCARPVGSGGTGNAGDDVPFRCSFWKWDSDVRARQPRLDRDQDGSARSFHEVAGRAPRLGSGEKRGLESIRTRAPHKAVYKRQKGDGGGGE
jgi:AP endonuclease-2